MTNKLGDVKRRCGCGQEPDSLLHYVSCRPLWDAVAAALSGTFPAFACVFQQLAEAPPSHRWGIGENGEVKTSRQQVQSLAVAAATYQQLAHEPHLSPLAAAHSAAVQLCSLA